MRPAYCQHRANWRNEIPFITKCDIFEGNVSFIAKAHLQNRERSAKMISRSRSVVFNLLKVAEHLIVML